MDNEETLDMFATFITRVVGNQKLKDGVMENIVYSPVRSFFSLGNGVDDSGPV